MVAPREHPPDAADALPTLSRAEEVALWRSWLTRQPPEDPLRRWAQRRLVAAGLLADPGEPRGARRVPGAGGR